MLGAELVVQAVVDVYFVELVLVGQRPAGDVDVVARVILHREDHRVARVGDHAIYLEVKLFVWLFIQVVMFPQSAHKQVSSHRTQDTGLAQA